MSNPKILIIDSYYRKMLKLIDDDNRKLSQTEWEIVYDELLLGTGFSYNFFIKKFGYCSNLLIANNSKQYGNSLSKFRKFHWEKAYYYSRIFGCSKLLFDISPMHQSILNFIDEINPNIIFVQDINLFPPIITSILRSRNIKIIGEIASPLPPDNFFANFDLVISSLENLVYDITKLNVRSTFHQLGFDPRINDRINFKLKDIDIVFVGSFTKQHKNTIPLLKEFAKNFSTFRIYGNFPETVLKEANLSKNYFGEVWGKSMFEILSRSKIVVNRHSIVSGTYANNMRMFEVTGVGSLLLTENKTNLEYYFSSKNEVVTYSSVFEAIEVAKDLLNKEDLLNKISKSGQERTLKDHSYENLTSKLVAHLYSVI